MADVNTMTVFDVTVNSRDLAVVGYGATFLGLMLMGDMTPAQVALSLAERGISVDQYIDSVENVKNVLLLGALQEATRG